MVVELKVELLSVFVHISFSVLSTNKSFSFKYLLHTLRGICNRQSPDSE